MKSIEELKRFCVVMRDDFFHSEQAYILRFEWGNAIVTIRIKLQDYTKADVLFTHMTTRPDAERRKGWGTKAVKIVLEWAHTHNLTDIRAVQVGREAETESFWKQNGFVPTGNLCNDFIYKGRR